MPSLLAAALLLALLLLTVLVVALRARHKRKESRPTREASAFVILEGNLWDGCRVDDLEEPCGVPAGRHRIRTTTSAGDATLDVVVYPGEVLAWRLDAERGRWEPHDLDGETRSLLEATPPSTTNLAAARPKTPGWLVHLRTTMNLVSARAGAPPAKAADDGVDRVRKRFAKLVARAASDPEAQAKLLAEARGLGESLIGRPLTRREIRGLVGPARDHAERLAAHGDTARAMCVLGLGLALLPGDPELMVVAGCTLAARGEADEALRALNAALERDRCLEADDVARAMRARMDLRSRLGRSVRV